MQTYVDTIYKVTSSHSKHKSAKIKKTYIVSQLGSISFVHKEAAETIPSSCLHFSLSFFS